MKAIQRSIYFIIISVVTIIFFQNCSKQAVKFDDQLSVINNNLTTFGTCNYDGQPINNGESIIAYLESSVFSGSQCESERRECKDGILSGSYQFKSCSIGGPRSCTFNGKIIPDKGYVKAYLNPTTAEGTICKGQIRQCRDGVLSGTYSYAICDTRPVKACLFNDLTIEHGKSVTAFEITGQDASGNNICSSEVRTCNDGDLSGINKLSNCPIALKNPCDFSGKIIASGQVVKAFKTSAVYEGASCEQENRICTNGQLSGSFVYQSCEIVKKPVDTIQNPPPDNSQNTTAQNPPPPVTTQPNNTCLFDGKIYTENQTFTAYKNRIMPTFQSGCARNSCYGHDVSALSCQSLKATCKGNNYIEFLDATNFKKFTNIFIQENSSCRNKVFDLQQLKIDVVSIKNINGYYTISSSSNRTTFERYFSSDGINFQKTGEFIPDRKKGSTGIVRIFDLGLNKNYDYLVNYDNPELLDVYIYPQTDYDSVQEIKVKYYKQSLSNLNNLNYPENVYPSISDCIVYYGGKPTYPLKFTGSYSSAGIDVSECTTTKIISNSSGLLHFKTIPRSLFYQYKEDGELKDLSLNLQNPQYIEIKKFAPSN